ncbi:MAG: hypothetical protein IJ228_07630 [Succinivibrio sp.]|nr:hypothetical protein [Succinivibrio sp.]
MKNRNGIRTEISSLYRARITSWLTEHVKNENHAIDGFPCRIYLGAPTRDEDVKAHKEQFIAFCEDWHKDLAAGKVDFLEKNYPGIGTVEVPIHLVFERPDEIVTWAGHLVEYHSALRRLDIIAAQLPDLIDSALDNISSLTTLDDLDFQHFVDVCKWICTHRNSGSLIRQINVRGVDTAWFESHRSILLTFLRDFLDLNPLRKDLLQLGLLPPSPLVRVVVLDHVLRNKIGGLRYFAAPIGDLQTIDIKPARVVFFEDVSTALSVPDVPGTVIVITPTHSLSELCKTDWIAGAKCDYSGSISLRSFAVLNNFRVYLPNTNSLLMDEGTFVTNKDLWTYDDILAQDQPQPMALTAEEMSFYRMLASGMYGLRARIDQERIPLELIYKALGVGGEELDTDIGVSIDDQGKDSYALDEVKNRD